MKMMFNDVVFQTDGNMFFNRSPGILQSIHLHHTRQRQQSVVLDRSLGARQGHTGHGADTNQPRQPQAHQLRDSSLSIGNWIRQIGGRLTVPAVQEYLNVWDNVRDVQLADHNDRLVWRWTADGTYSSCSAHKALPTRHRTQYRSAKESGQHELL